MSHLFPGSSWVNEILFMLMSGASREQTLSTHYLDKAPYLEFVILDTSSPYASVVEKIECTPSPRLIKSHLPLRYFQKHLDKEEKSPKFIIPIRNPKDTLVSFYHMYMMCSAYGGFSGTWDEFFRMHQRHKLHYCDIFEHMAAWWKLRDHPNVLIIKYEDHIKDPARFLQKIADFLGQPLSTERMRTILEMTSFKHMSSDAYLYSREHFKETDDMKFFRKGKVGGWKEFFTDEQNQYIDKQCEKHFTPIGLTFEYEASAEIL